MLGRVLEGLADAVGSAGTVLGVRDATEEPPYEVIGLVNGAEVRRYGERLAAEVTVPGEEGAARQAGFRPLAGFIFGGNEAREKMAMTIPVAQASAGAGEWTVRFFMPAGYTEATLPRPRDASVRILTVPGGDYAVLRFRGVPSADAVALRKARLMAALGCGPWQAEGEPEGWFYDPPWTVPTLRRNEVAVRVSQREPAQPPA